MACRGDGDFASKKDRPFPCRTLPPDIHFKMCKKVAQLTKVIYTLNVRLDEQNAAIEEVKGACEERVRQLLADTRQKLSCYKNKAELTNKLEQRVSDLEMLLEKERRERAELETDLSNLRERWKTDLRQKEECLRLLKVSEDKLKCLGTSLLVNTDVPEKDVHKVPEYSNHRTGNGGDTDCSVSSTTDFGSLVEEPDDYIANCHLVDEKQEALCQRKRHNLENVLRGKNQEITLLREKTVLLEMELVRYKENIKSSQEADILEYEVTVRELQDKIFQLQNVLEQCRPEQEDVGVQTNEDSNLCEQCSDTTDGACTSAISAAAFQHLRKDLSSTMRELQSATQILKDTKEELKHMQEKLHHQGKNSLASTTLVDRDLGTSVRGAAKVEMREKVTELLQCILFLNAESQENLSDAEKCGEAKLNEVKAYYNNLLTCKDADYQQLLGENEVLQNKLVEYQQKVGEHQKQWDEERSAMLTESASRLEELRAKMEREKSDLLAAQITQQTQQFKLQQELVARLTQELRDKEATSIHRECLLMQQVEDERDKGETLANQSQKLQLQLDAVVREMEQKREELLLVRKESTQQIRNLENYWLQKVSYEVEKSKKFLADEKLAMNENFLRQKQLLKNKIIVLQAKNHKCVENGYAKLPPPPRIRRNVLASRDEVPAPPTIPCEPNVPDRCANKEKSVSQPNVSAVNKDTCYKTKEKPRKIPERKFIRRAESMLLPRLQFLSFWKSVDKLPRSRSVSNGMSVFRALMGDPSYDPLRSSSCCNLSDGEQRPASGKRNSLHFDNLEAPFLETEEDDDDCDGQTKYLRKDSLLESEL